MTGASGSVGDDSEPLEIQKHAPIKSDNVDMRVNVLKEYILKVPNATLKDLKKALTGFSKATDDEFKELIKSANPDKYNEIYLIKKQIRQRITITQTIKLPYIEIISTDIIESGSPYKQNEIIFLQTYSHYTPKHIFILYKTAFPNSNRNPQFVSDFRHLIKKHPDKYIIKDAPKSSLIKHNVSVTTPTNSHILAQTITALYKSGKSPKIFSEIKPVIELLQDPNEIAFAIECLTS